GHWKAAWGKLRRGRPRYSRAGRASYCSGAKEATQDSLGCVGLVAMHAMAGTGEDFEAAEIFRQSRVDLSRTADRRDRIIIAAEHQRGAANFREFQHEVHVPHFAEREVAADF